VQCIKNYGGTDIRVGSSDWIIDEAEHRYMWLAMYRFIVLGAFFPTLCSNEGSFSVHTILGVLKKLIRSSGNVIIAKNSDIMFR